MWGYTRVISGVIVSQHMSYHGCENTPELNIESTYAIYSLFFLKFVLSTALVISNTLKQTIIAQMQHLLLVDVFLVSCQREHQLFLSQLTVSSLFRFQSIEFWIYLILPHALLTHLFTNHMLQLNSSWLVCLHYGSSTVDKFASLSILRIQLSIIYVH